jgi:hypothetical protein
MAAKIVVKFLIRYASRPHVIENGVSDACRAVRKTNVSKRTDCVGIHLHSAAGVDLHDFSLNTLRLEAVHELIGKFKALATTL